MADIQLREQVLASPDLAVGIDAADYDIWLREQFPAYPDISCYPTEWGIRQPAAGGHASISGVLGITLDGITAQISGAVSANIDGTIAFALDGVTPQINGLVTGNVTGSIAFTLSGIVPQFMGVVERASSRPAMDGAYIHGRRRLPADIEREQRMVEEYLSSLDRRRAAIVKKSAATARAAKRVVVPVEPELTEAIVRAASAEQLRRIAESRAAQEATRARVAAERRRRTLILMLALED
jgi:hypothetical protein